MDSFRHQLSVSGYKNVLLLLVLGGPLLLGNLMMLLAVSAKYILLKNKE